MKTWVRVLPNRTKVIVLEFQVHAVILTCDLHFVQFAGLFGVVGMGFWASAYRLKQACRDMTMEVAELGIVTLCFASTPTCLVSRVHPTPTLSVADVSLVLPDPYDAPVRLFLLSGVC